MIHKCTGVTYIFNMTENFAYNLLRGDISYLPQNVLRVGEFFACASVFLHDKYD